MPPDQLAEKKSFLASTSENAAFSVEVGQVLVGKYRVDKILGKGGMGVVVAAMHLQLQERVALKFLLPTAGLGRMEEFTARFLREAKVSAKLRNEHAVKVSDMGVLDNGAPYMVMEYLDGTDLNKILRREAPLELTRALDYFIQACEGLAEAHSLGVVHRDLKPSNLFVSRRRDGSDLLKVLDFGISKANLIDSADLDDLTAAGTMMGSPKYMSPEQLTDTARVDERADVWSLAVMLYEMLTGTPPFVAETHALTCMKVLGPNAPEPIGSKRDDVPPELEDAVLHALDRDLSCRTRDVAQFAEEVLDSVRGAVPDSLWVSLERIQGTLHSRDREAGVPFNASTSQRLPAVGFKGVRLSQTLSSTSSGSHASVTEPVQPSRRRGIVLAALVGVLLLGGALFIGLRQGEPPTAALAAANSAPPAALQDAGPPEPSAALTAAVPVDTLQPDAAPPAEPPPASTGGRAAPARWVPPPAPRPRESAPPPAPSTPPTKRVDPLSERQ